MESWRPQHQDQGLVQWLWALGHLWGCTDPAPSAGLGSGFWGTPVPSSFLPHSPASLLGTLGARPGRSLVLLFRFREGQGRREAGSTRVGSRRALRLPSADAGRSGPARHAAPPRPARIAGTQGRVGVGRSRPAGGTRMEETQCSSTPQSVRGGRRRGGGRGRMGANLPGSQGREFGEAWPPRSRPGTGDPGPACVARPGGR